MTHVMKIVLTGGPCAGKTTALAMIEERLTALGYRVFIVPEVATMALNNGLRFTGLTRDQYVYAERQFLRLQLELETSFEAFARQCEKSVVICDRGTMDVKSYLDAHEWERVCATVDFRFRFCDVSLRDERYVAVIHMRTVAASGSGYTKENNAARQENAEEAILADKRTLEAWLGHPHLRVIENEEHFEDKARKVVRAVCAVLGEPLPVERERKFLVRFDGELPVNSVTVSIEQTYLSSPDEDIEERVRRRGHEGSWLYTHTIKQGHGEHRVERERRITAREYADMLLRADPDRMPIQKLRTCFVWGRHYFELDTFVSPRQGLHLLEVEFDEPGAELELPPFLEVLEEVTEKPEYSNAQIARTK